MHYHELVFSAEDTTVLKKVYGKLLHKLNLGKTLQPEYLADLTQVMQELLYAQAPLTAFWQTVEAAPENTYHLHLVHRDKELLNLPWQMAVDEVKHPSVFISKGFTTERPATNYTPQAGPLKILVMISSPEDEHASKRLSYETEEEAILEALKPLYEKDQVQVSFTSSGSLENLETMLAREQYHLLYFSGHSSYRLNTGYLLLEDENTLEGIEVTANEFATAVCKNKTQIPALVVLASCQSAEGDVEEGFPGVADELLAAGVPAVIAMAFSIPDRYVTVFASHLFGALAQQELLLTAYVDALHGLGTAEAAYAMEQDYYLAPTQWLIPQLYCSSPIEHIVKWSQKNKPAKNKRTPVITDSPYRFIGRRRELSRLLPLLHAGKPVLLTGQAGVGKTALAEKAVQRLLAANSRMVPFRFEDGNTGLEATKTHLTAFLHLHEQAARDYKTATPEYLAETVRKVCRPLWIVDDIDVMQTNAGGYLQEAHKAWFSWLLQHVVPYDPVLFISRYQVPELAQIPQLSINEDSPENLYIHLQQLNAGDLLLDYPHIAPLQISEIIFNVLGGNYKAWDLFDRVYGKQTTTLSKTIEKIAQAIDPSTHRPLYKKITALIQKELDKERWPAGLSKIAVLLQNEHWQALQILAHFRTPVSLMALEMQQAAIAWQPVLTTLHALALVEERIRVMNDIETACYCIPRLVKNWLQQQKPAKAPYSAKQAGDYYLMVGRESEDLFDFVEAFWHYLPVKPVQEINETGKWLARKYYNLGMYEEAMNYALHTENICGDETLPEVLNLLGAVYGRLGDLTKAKIYWSDFYEAAKKTNDRAEQGLALSNLASASHELGQTEEATTLMEKALALSQELGDQETIAERLNSLGKIIEEQQGFTKAKALYEESLRIRKELEDRTGEASTLLNLADVYIHLGELDKAQQSLQYCISVFKEEGATEAEAAAYEKLGHLYEAIGSIEQALDVLHKAFQLYRALRNPNGQLDVLGHIGQLYTHTGHSDNALAYLTKSLELAQLTNQINKEAITLVHLSELYRSTGEPEKGITYVNDALMISKKLKDKSGEADCLFQLGRLYHDMDNKETSHQYFRQSKILYEKTGTFREDILDAIENYLLLPEETDKRLSILKKQLDDRRQKGNRLHEADVLYQMAEIALDTEQPDDFFEWGFAAYDIYIDLDHLPGIYRAGCMLGELLFLSEDEEDRAEGLELLQQSFGIGQAEDYPDTQAIAAFIKENS